MTWAELRDRLNAAIPDDTSLVVVNVELAWPDGADDVSNFHLSWSEPGGLTFPAPDDQLVQIGKL